MSSKGDLNPNEGVLRYILPSRALQNRKFFWKFCQTLRKGFSKLAFSRDRQMVEHISLYPIISESSFALPLSRIFSLISTINRTQKMNYCPCQRCAFHVHLSFFIVPAALTNVCKPLDLLVVWHSPNSCWLSGNGSHFKLCSVGLAFRSFGKMSLRWHFLSFARCRTAKVSRLYWNFTRFLPKMEGKSIFCDC